MNNFVAGVVASLIATAISGAVGLLFAVKHRRVLFYLSEKALDSGLEYVYVNRKSSDEDIATSVANSSQVLILSARGHFYQDDHFSGLFNSSVCSPGTVRVLLSDPSPGDEYNWVRQREKELQQFDPSFGAGLLSSQVVTTIQFLENYRRSGQIKLGLVNFPVIGRLILTDESVFFNPMKADKHIRRSRTYRFSRDSDMYRHYYRLFEQLWDVRKEPN